MHLSVLCPPVFSVFQSLTLRSLTLPLTLLVTGLSFHLVED